MLNTTYSSMDNKIWMYVLIALLLIYLAIFLYYRVSSRKLNEGFQQQEHFVVRRDNDIYDEFYVEIYDRLMLPEKRVPFELKSIISNTQASEASSFLEIGSGTGYLVDALKKRNFQAYGIDLSEPMVEYSTSKYPDIQIKCGDTMDPLAFEKSTFSHILCMNFTIYQFQDKVAFLRNCYHWLLPNAYLVLHLVDPAKYDTIIPAGKPKMEINMQSYSDSRITNTEIDFGNFQYSASTQFLPSSSDNEEIVVITEKMTDRVSKKVRQNEQTLYMEPVSRIIQTARFCGFIMKGKINYLEQNGDANQYLYFLEKIL